MFNIPLRQKKFLFIVVVTGLFIFIVYALGILNIEIISLLIIFYGFGIPFFFLSTDLIIDLKDTNVFKIWGLLGIAFVIIFVLLQNDSSLLIRHKDADDSRIKDWVSDSSAASLKSLPSFLAFYWIMNSLLKKTRGKYIVSTYKLSKWYSTAANREVDGIDVLINLILYATIILGAIVKT